MKSYFRTIYLLIIISSCYHFDRPVPIVSPTVRPMLEVTETPSFIPTEDEDLSGSRTINFPEWVKRSWPDNLLTLPFDQEVSNNRPSKLIFINPDNGETFVVDLEKVFYHYYWKDYDRIIFFHGLDCSNIPEFVSVLNIESGVLQIYLAKDYPELIMSCFFNFADEVIRLDRGNGEGSVRYINPVTGDTSLITDTNDGTTDISAKLSSNQNFVAVVQYVGDYEFSEYWRPEYGNQISIYDIKTKKLLLQYQEKQGILSEISFIDYSNLVYIRENTPCVIMILSLSKSCIHKIPNQFPDSTIVLSENTHEDVNGFGFLYFSQYEGGFCFYNIFNGALDCPTWNFSAFKNQRITNYSLSPFGHYLLLEYDSEGCPVPWCDNFDNPKLAIIDLDDSELFELGPADEFFIHPFLRPLQPDPWRPK